MPEQTQTNRIAKVMARAGLCSRREAERWIAAGRVQVDGVTIDSAALNVTDDNKISVDGKPLPQKSAARIWMFHKPKGIITTNLDPEGRQTIFDILPDNMPRVITIGRLDYNSEGLILLTNDGDLSRKIELPATGWVRTYKARAYGTADNKKLEQLKKGATIDGVKYAASKITLDKKQSGNNIWLNVSITEGKNREVRKMLSYAGLEVNRLIRTSFGSFKLGDLAAGDIKEVDMSAVEF